MKIETVMLGPETQQYAGQGQNAMTISKIAQAARKLEELGFDGVTSPEAGHDPFLPLVIAAEHTERVKLGTNVAIAFPRSPMVTAQVAWDLQQLSKGRFRLGLGTQVKGHVERRYVATWSGPPGPRMREYLLCMRAIFASFSNPKKPTYYEGAHYQFTMLPPFFNPGPIDYAPPEICIAAVNPYMARLSGELCDGLRLHPIATFRYTQDVVLPAIEEGAKKAGRSAADIDLIGAPFLAISEKAEDLARAKRELAQHIAFYASTRTYHAVLEFHGWQEVGRKLHELSREGKWTEMPDAITDEMLEEWALIGTADDLVSLVKKRCTGIFSTVLLDLPPALRAKEDWVRATVKALHE